MSILSLILTALGVGAIAQERQLNQDQRKPSDKRTALVIGNGAYTKAKSLPNPSNDAADMAKVLKELGFDVLSGVDLNKRQIENLIRDFGAKLALGGTGLFYYAGHGVQVGGENYLIPVDADIPEQDEVAYASVSLSLVLGKMAVAKNDLNIVILDACRNNPFARSWSGFRDVGNDGGLARISPPSGTMVLYATEPGKVASAGTGRNGLFTESLLIQMKKPNIEFEAMVKLLAKDVKAKSGNKQSPWKEGLYDGDFYFARSKVLVKGETVITENVTAKDLVSVEREAWNYIRASTNAQDFRDFLKEFPTGANATNAKIKLEQAAWDAVKDGKDKAKIQAYLGEFPSGTNAPLARIKLRQLEAPVVTPPTTTPGGGNAANTSGAVAAGTVRKNSIGMDLVYVPPGEFMMGSSESDIDESLYIYKKEYSYAKREAFDNEKPQHRVTISNGFWMGKYEVTQGQWQAVMGDNPSNFKDCGANCPIEQVSWDDIQVFLRKLNQKNDGFEYSLPSEAQWEYAARAGTTTLYGGTGNLDDLGWYGKNSGRKTHPVGEKRANGFGLYDMHGNVWEWCSDWYGSYSSGQATDPTAASSGQSRVLRGGSWFNVANYSRSAFRSRNSPADRYSFYGFRVVARGK